MTLLSRCADKTSKYTHVRNYETLCSLGYIFVDKYRKHFNIIIGPESHLKGRIDGHFGLAQTIKEQAACERWLYDIDDVLKACEEHHKADEASKGMGPHQESCEYRYFDFLPTVPRALVPTREFDPKSLPMRITACHHWSFKLTRTDGKLGSLLSRTDSNKITGIICRCHVLPYEKCVAERTCDGRTTFLRLKPLKEVPAEKVEADGKPDPAEKGDENAEKGDEADGKPDPAELEEEEAEDGERKELTVYGSSTAVPLKLINWQGWKLTYKGQQVDPKNKPLTNSVIIKRLKRKFGKLEAMRDKLLQPVKRHSKIKNRDVTRGQEEGHQGEAACFLVESCEVQAPLSDLFD